MERKYLSKQMFDNPVLIDYWLEASVPFDINTVSNVDKLSIVLLNRLGIGVTMNT